MANIERTLTAKKTEKEEHSWRHLPLPLQTTSQTCRNHHSEEQTHGLQERHPTFPAPASTARFCLCPAHPLHLSFSSRGLGPSRLCFGLKGPLGPNSACLSSPSPSPGPSISVPASLDCSVPWQRKFLPLPSRGTGWSLRLGHFCLTPHSCPG